MLEVLGCRKLLVIRNPSDCSFSAPAAEVTGNDSAAATAEEDGRSAGEGAPGPGRWASPRAALAA